MTTKIKKVEMHLKKKKSITSWDAITLYRATRLSAIIHKFRERGMDITSKRMTGKDENGNPVNFVKYILNKSLVIAICFALVSCNKEQPKCNCGTIVSDEVSDYSVVIRNKCSGNEKKFNLAEGDWMNAYVGSEFCITNVQNW